MVNLKTIIFSAALLLTSFAVQAEPEPKIQVTKEFNCYDIHEMDDWFNNNGYYPVFYWKDELSNKSNTFFWFNGEVNTLVIAVVPIEDITIACAASVSSQFFLNEEGFEKFVKDFLNNRTNKEAT